MGLDRGDLKMKKVDAYGWKHVIWLSLLLFTVMWLLPYFLGEPLALISILIVVFAWFSVRPAIKKISRPESKKSLILLEILFTAMVYAAFCYYFLVIRGV